MVNVRLEGELALSEIRHSLTMSILILCTLAEVYIGRSQKSGGFILNGHHWSHIAFPFTRHYSTKYFVWFLLVM
jgi:hypothetical protein